MPRSTVHRIVHRVTEEVLAIRHKVIHLPKSQDELQPISRGRRVTVPPAPTPPHHSLQEANTRCGSPALQQPSLQGTLQRAFGMMKTRFRAILLQALEVHHTFVPHVITACAILHNICLGAGDIVAPEDEPEEDEAEDEGENGLETVSHGRLATAKKPERQVTRMVVVMIVAFMVGWTPYAIFAILVTAHPTIELDPRMASIPAFFSKTAAVYNPIIYVFMNKQFRKCLIQLFTGRGTIPDSNMNQTSERPGITAESQTGEMSAIAARIPEGGNVSPRSDDSPTNCGSFAQLPIPENKVCPM
ncbi:opsin-VA-like [Micropterus dolomieu]|uniref:opsin-VA-like n=1 Tax=Micropterus dolomieu TaxID=147949 RepID=UPI001E8CB74E|nr:opsin-VA-like [Micropterus dolomieu]